MSTISTSVFTTETKRIAAMVEAFITAMGEDNTETGTTGKGAANALTAILALTDAEQLNALLPAAQNYNDAMVAGGYYYGGLYDWLLALDAHVGGINDFCTDNSIRVHHRLRDVLSTILPKSTFPPVTDFGSMVLSGSGAGTFTAQDTVDTDEYGDGLVELVTESAIGVADIEVFVTGTNFDGDTVNVSATIPNGTSDDTTIAVNETTVRMVSVSTVTVTGGTAADAFRVQTKLDRSPAGLT